MYTPAERVKPRKNFLPHGVDPLLADIDRVDPTASRVHIVDGRVIDYDQLVIATGTTPRPEETPGMTDEHWRESIFDFYRLDGAVALRDKLTSWTGARLVVHITEMPIKCPVAPLAFAFLADAFVAERPATTGGSGEHAPTPPGRAGGPGRSGRGHSGPQRYMRMTGSVSDAAVAVWTSTAVPDRVRVR